MLSVTARKIREHGRGGPRATSTMGSACEYRGYLLSFPVVGRGMIIFHDPHGQRMITTPVKRVLGGPGGTTIYVETENSVYRVTVHGETLAVPPASAGEAAG